MITTQTQTLIRLYRHYNNGVLPLSGGILDQPHSFTHAMEVLDAWQCET
ncbi:MAG: hypothetical protein COB61_004270 [Thiotrichales bacterium]|nr:hypothetical protein [Thiotrichales bacterium]